jgi:hypothetical protein
VREVLVREGLTAVAARPWLWRTAIVQLFRLAPTGWWRRRPFLPLPDPEYLAFRLRTMYGDPGHGFEPHDLVAYLDWCRSHRRLVR